MGKCTPSEHWLNGQDDSGRQLRSFLTLQKDEIFCKTCGSSFRAESGVCKIKQHLNTAKHVKCIIQYANQLRLSQSTSSKTLKLVVAQEAALRAEII